MRTCLINSNIKESLSNQFFELMLKSTLRMDLLVLRSPTTVFEEKQYKVRTATDASPAKLKPLQTQARMLL